MSTKDASLNYPAIRLFMAACLGLVSVVLLALFAAGVQNAMLVPWSNGFKAGWAMWTLGVMAMMAVSLYGDPSKPPIYLRALSLWSENGC